MRLSEVVTHTANWCGVPHTAVASYARALRQGRAITVGGVGGAAAELTPNDKLTLLMAVAGCATARTSAEDVRGWLKLTPFNRHDPSKLDFLFLKQPTFVEALFSLMVEDLPERAESFGAGKIHKFIRESDQHAEAHGMAFALHEIKVEFSQDSYEAVISVLREIINEDGVTEFQTAEARYSLPPSEAVLPLRNIIGIPGIPSPYIFRLTERSLRGWGTCLDDEAGWVNAT